MFADGVRPLDLIDPVLILNPPTPWNEFKTTFKSTPAAMLHLLVGQAPSLEDYALKLRRLTADKPEWELSTDRVFIDDPIATKLTKHLPESQGVLTYLVNGISSKTGATPYSMVTATDAFPSGIRNSKSEIVVTQWLADDLGIKAGDKVDMRYFVVGIGRELKERLLERALLEGLRGHGELQSRQARVNRLRRR